MKINDIISTYPQQTVTKNKKKHKPSFSFENLEILKTKTGDEYVKVDILDKDYNFMLIDGVKNPKKLNKMIENIKQTLTGFFVREDKHEYFIPNVSKKIPNISENLYLVENGNAVTELNDETDEVLKFFESTTKEQVNIDDLKTIKYMTRTVNGFDNNVVKTAYSYFDKINNDLYLYMPNKRRLQVLTNSNLIKNIRLL